MAGGFVEIAKMGKKGALIPNLFVAVSLVLLFLTGVRAREFRGEMKEGDFFWMESAQRYRYIEILAEGGEIPDPDRAMAWPHGYPPLSDTLLQEYLYGISARLFLGGKTAGLHDFVMTFTHIFFSLSILPLFLLVRRATGHPVPGLVAVSLFLFPLPVVERSSGTEILRETVAFPFLITHLFFMVEYLRGERWWRAWLSALFLILAFLAWKVIYFYYIILIIYFIVQGSLSEKDPTKNLQIPILVLLTAASLLPLHLRHDEFPASIPFLFGLSTAISALFLRQWVRYPPVRMLIPFILLTLLKFLPIHPSPSYSHAWETIFYKVRYLNRKPEDPSLLPFHARHFWTGNYNSPTLKRFMRDFSLLFLSALPGILLLVSGVVKRGPRTDTPFLLYLLVAFTGIYLLFYKLQNFFALALSLAAGTSYAMLKKDGMKRPGTLPLTLFYAVMVPLILIQTFGAFSIEVPSGRGGEEGEWNLTSVHSPSAFSELTRFLEGSTRRGDSILASFVISPYILAYIKRPVVLNAFFESPNVERFREFVEVLFGREEDFFRFCKRYDVKYFVYEAHFLLRRDKRMSLRYVAGRVRDPGDEWAATLFHFFPERLKGFDLVWGNGYFRVYRVAEEGEGGRIEGDGALEYPLFDPALFDHLLEEGRVLGSDDFFYRYMEAERQMKLGRTLLEEGRVEEGTRALIKAGQIFPLFEKGRD